VFVKIHMCISSNVADIKITITQTVIMLIMVAAAIIILCFNF